MALLAACSVLSLATRLTSAQSGFAWSIRATGRESIATHKLYVSRSGWDDEKALSALEIGRHYETLGEYAEARDWAGQALQVRETWAEPYFLLGRCWYFLAQAAQG